jgi:hypothetical protein
VTSFAARIPWLVRVRRNAARERSRMFRGFVASLRRPVRILDLGGTAEMWSRWQVTAADGFAITLLNHHRYDPTQRQATVTQPFIHDCRGDALRLSASDLAAFDVVFSNSMLEHLPSPADQAALARFIAATGLPYFIQVPNKYSPVDPHFPAPAGAVLRALSEAVAGSPADLVAPRQRWARRLDRVGTAAVRRLSPARPARPAPAVPAGQPEDPMDLRAADVDHCPVAARLVLPRAVRRSRIAG